MVHFPMIIIASYPLRPKGESGQQKVEQIHPKWINDPQGVGSSLFTV
jgi:hypothetical protein